MFYICIYFKNQFHCLETFNCAHDRYEAQEKYWSRLLGPDLNKYWFQSVLIPVRKQFSKRLPFILNSLTETAWTNTALTTKSRFYSWNSRSIEHRCSCNVQSLQESCGPSLTLFSHCQTQRLFSKATVLAAEHYSKDRQKSICQNFFLKSETSVLRDNIFRCSVYQYQYQGLWL